MYACMHARVHAADASPIADFPIADLPVYALPIATLEATGADASFVPPTCMPPACVPAACVPAACVPPACLATWMDGPACLATWMDGSWMDGSLGAALAVPHVCARWRPRQAAQARKRAALRTSSSSASSMAGALRPRGAWVGVRVSSRGLRAGGFRRAQGVGGSSGFVTCLGPWMVGGFRHVQGWGLGL